MTFHRLTRANDSAGIVATVFAIDKHGKHDRKTYATSADKLAPSRGPIRLEQSTLQQGPLRHADFIEWSDDGSPFGSYFVVSPRVHALLEKAALPAHRVLEAAVQWPKSAYREHGRGEAPYFVYVFDQVASLDAYDLGATGLSCTVRQKSERLNAHTDLPPGSVASGAEAWERAKALCPSGQRPWVLPTALLCAVNDDLEPELDFESAHFPIATRDVDLIFLDHSFDPWVSDGLRDALLAMQATGFDFPESWDATRLSAPQTPERAQRAGALGECAASHAGPPPSDPAFEKQQQRRLEVLARRDRLRQKRGAPKGPIETIEQKLDVEFPADYRAALTEGHLPDSGRFHFLPMAELQTIDDIDPEWTKRSAPQAVRALIVAIDGSGDFLGYILREDSMTALDDALVHFHHETAAITPSRFRFTPKESSKARE